jgi:MoxR-like ATPase
MSPSRDPTPMRLEELVQTIAALKRQLSEVIIDQPNAIHQTLLAVSCGGHVLIEDVPGVGKTLLARSLAQALGVTFARIQGTTDLLPAEITGSTIWNEQTRTFEFHPGPLMHQCVLFDELNRATPKTQSALLEAMQEGQVTVDGVTHPLPQPFFVLATQNPIDYEGTFALTEAQRDRFFMQVTMGYPSEEGARRLLDIYLAPDRQTRVWAHAPQLAAVVRPEQVQALFAARAHVFLDPQVRDYILALMQATRTHPEVRLGLSPRASLMIGQAAQAQAAFVGQDFVTPDDVRAILGPVAAHRLILYSKAELAGRTAQQVVDEIAQTVPAPAWPAMGRAASRSRPLPRIPGR